MKKIILSLIVLFYLSSVSFSQQIVTGNVSEQSGNPLPEVKISVKNTDVTTKSDEAGRYSITLPAGKKVLTFFKEGYQVQEVIVNKNVVNIIMNASIAELFNLTLEELMNMDVVTASKYVEPLQQTPATVFVLTYQELVNRGYTMLSEVLNDIPGYDIAAAYGNLTQLAYARGNRTGSYNERTMLMIDGIESNILYAQNMNISSDFPLTAIDRIEIIYGPASAIYGPNVFSGVINVITKSASDLKNNTNRVFIQNGIGTDNTQFAEITYLAKYNPVELSVTYRRYKSDMFDMTGRPGYFDEKLFGNPRLWGPYAEYYPEFDNRVDDNALISRIKIKNIELGYNHLLTKHGNGSEYTYDKTMPTTNWKFGRDIFFLKYNNNFSDDLSISFLATYQKGGSLPDNVWSQGWNSYDDWDSLRTVELLTWKYISRKWSIFQDFEYRPSKHWIINGGIKYSSAEYQKSYEFGRSDQTIWLPGEDWTAPDVLFPYPIGSAVTPGNTFIDTEFGGFVQGKVLVMDNKISLLAGVRYDNNKIYGEIFSPRIGATYKVNNYLNLKTSYGTGFQSPAPRNLYGSWGGLEVNEDLEPDRIQSIDLNVSTHFNNFGAIVTFFGNKITNSILQGENLPTKKIFGLECKLNYILVRTSEYFSNSRIHLNYSFVKARYTKERTNATTGRSSEKIGDIAPHKLNLIACTDILEHLHFNIRMNYVAERPTVISNPVEKVDAFFITHLNFQLINLFDDKLRVFFNINNLFDVEYYHPGMDAANGGEDLSSPSDGWYSSRLPQPGRSFTGGIFVTL